MASLLGAHLALATGSPCAASDTNLEPAAATDSTEKITLQFNFRATPIANVLDYMSQTGGFIVIQDTPVEGTVDAWSQQPLNREESVAFLNTILKKLGCAAVCHGRTLTIFNPAQANQYDLPIKLVSRSNQPPDSDAMVTLILPVRVGKAADMAQILRPLVPSPGSLVATESGNAVVITANQHAVNRISKILKTLNDAGSKTGTIKIFNLKNADAKNLASVVNETFSNSGRASASSRQNAANRSANSGSGGSGSGGDSPPPGAPGSPGGGNGPGGSDFGVPGGFGGPPPGGGGPGVE